MKTSIGLKKLVKSVANVTSGVQTTAILALSSTALAIVLSPSAQAASLTNGTLTVDINDSNGAIGSAIFSGTEFYREGTFVSDFGFQNDTDTSTFAKNDAFGLSGVSVSVTPGSGFITVAGTYTGGGSISFSRVYSLVPGLNVLRTTTTLLNSGTTDTTLSLFDTFDPDQGVSRGSGFNTTNDVSNLATGAGSAKVGQATESGGYSVVIGSLKPDVTVASGNPFAIFGGSDLNSFFASPFDGNGAFDDQGTHIGLRALLTAGSSLNFTFDQAFGTTASEARSAFVAANPGSTAVPTPALLPGLIGLGFGVLRKRKGEAAKQTSEV